MMRMAISEKFMTLQNHLNFILPASSKVNPPTRMESFQEQKGNFIQMEKKRAQPPIQREKRRVFLRSGIQMGSWQSQLSFMWDNAMDPFRNGMKRAQKRWKPFLPKVIL